MASSGKAARLLVPAAPAIHAGEETQSTARISDTTCGVDRRGEEGEIVGHVSTDARPPRFPREFEESALQLLALPGQEALHGVSRAAPFMFFMRQRLQPRCWHADIVGVEVGAQPCDPTDSRLPSA